MSKQMKLQGEDAMLRKLAKLAKNADKMLQPAMLDSVKIAEREAKRIVPEDTGTLRDSIRSRVSKRSKGDNVVGNLYIGKRSKGARNPQEYAHFVEFGTRYQKPRPFLRKSFYNRKSQIRKAIKSGFWKQILLAIRSTR